VTEHGWCIDELAYAGPEHLDPGFVEGYDRKQGFPSVDDDLQILRDHGALRPKSTVVDLGCGTGRFAVAAAAHCGRVVAVDVSAPMLAHIGSVATDAGVSNLECVHAGFLSYQHEGAPADAVFTRNALHQLPDFWKGVALHRVAQVLRPGGVLRMHDLVYDFVPADATAVLDAWLSGAVEDPAVGYTSEDLATHVRTEFSTYSWLLDTLLERTGFDILDRDVGAQVYASYTCVRR
jgi:ubiquinone/menaquinone biosynthesis C-methylase UbiE